MADVLLTGAAGRLGSVLRRALRDRHRLVLSDVVGITDLEESETYVQCDLADADAALGLLRDVDVVVHGAGIPDEAPFSDLLRANILATYNVFEAARRNGVRRIVYAGSAHVVGFHPTTAYLDERAELAPDSLYGVTKGFGEALGAMYARKHGLEVVSLRIGSFRPEPEIPRQLATWLSPDDAVRLVEASITADAPGFRIVYGVSANRRRWWSTGAGEAIGYHPRSDAEAFAARFDAGPEDGVWQGGVFTEPDYRGGAG